MCCRNGWCSSNKSQSSLMIILSGGLVCVSSALSARHHSDADPQAADRVAKPAAVKVVPAVDGPKTDNARKRP
jgi:hypothetical protein